MNLLASLKVRGPRVLVRELAGVSMTASGIILPGTQTEEMHHRGVVERVGPGERRDDGTHRDVGLEPGDLVFFAKFAGTVLVLDGQHRLVLMEDEIQAAIGKVDVPAVIEHPEETGGAADHLEGEPCAICRRSEDAALEEQAKASLAIERERLLAEL